MKYKNLNNTKIQNVPSQNNAKQSTGSRNNLSYNITGMPVGGVAIIYDKLHQIFEKGQYKSKAIRTSIVDTDGVIRLINLRDSVYSVQFQNIEHILYNISNLEVGNPEFFNTILENEIPYAVVITGIINGLNVENQAFLSIYWKLDSHQIKGYYEIWVKSDSDSSFLKHTTVYDQQATFYNVMPLDYGTTYSVKMKTVNSEGLSRGFSNTVNGLTLTNPFSSGVLDTTAPIGATFYY